MTRQRTAILEVIRSEKCHRTAEEIYELAKTKLSSVSRATVYNNLKALEKEKLIRRITAEDGSSWYDSSYIPHGHMICKACGRVSDFDISGFCGIIREAIGQDFESYELKVRALCQECERAKKSE